MDLVYIEKALENKSNERKWHVENGSSFTVYIYSVYKYKTLTVNRRKDSSEMIIVLQVTATNFRELEEKALEEIAKL